MPTKQQIITIGVLCIVAFGLGYWVGMPKEEGSGGNGKKEPEFLKEGLVAYYLFNGNANDESGNGHDGEAKGAVLAADRHGEDGKAYRFDGKDDFIEVPDSDDLDLGNKTGKEWTVAIWFKGNIKREGWLLRKGGSGGSRTTDYGVIASPNPVHRGFIWGIHGIRRGG